jgi:ligand-binding sensor domain-containing protein
LFASIGTNVFVGTDSSGVFLTTNNGTSYTPVNTSLPSKNIRALQSIGSNLFAATRAGVFLTTNNGT